MGNETRQKSRSSTRSRGFVRVASSLCVATVVNVSIAVGTARASTSIPAIVMVAQDDTAFPAAYPIADRLPPNGVVAVHVSGFDAYARAIAEQCLTGAFRSCANQISVQFDEDGEAQFQYLIDDDFYPSVAPAGGCRANAGRCTIVVRSVDGNARSEIQTIFLDSVAPPGRIEVAPSSGLSLDGEMVVVRVRDFPPGVNVQAMLCAVPSATGDRCGAPGAVGAIEVGPDGTGETHLFIAPGIVGADRARCFRGDRCGVSVFSESVFARAAVVPISFEGPIGARYSTARLMLWLGLALLFIAIAAVLLRRTDWSAVGEAAAPEIDDAVYADLDAIIASLPPDVDETLESPRRASRRG